MSDKTTPEKQETKVQYLTFLLDDEIFALEISKVREVLEMGKLTHIPRTPDYMRGVTNLRGNVVPVVDLKLKLDLERTEKTVDTSIILTELTIDDTELVVGVLADSVKEVLDINDADVEPPPRIGAIIDTGYIKGMGKKDDQFIIILNIELVFSDTDLTLVQEIAE